MTKQYRPPVDRTYNGEWDRHYNKTNSREWREAAADMLMFRRPHREMVRYTDTMLLILKALASDEKVTHEEGFRRARAATGIERLDFDAVLNDLRNTGIFAVLHKPTADRHGEEA